MSDEPSISWWRDTPWLEIREVVRLALSKRDFSEWLKRADVREREKIAP